MDKKIFLACILASFTHLALADTCPSVKDIKENKIAGWKAFDSDDGKPLPAKRTLAFTKAVEQFILAEWSNRDNKGASMHCFYRDKNGSDLEAYLTKSNLMPTQMKTWYQVSGSMQCAADNEMCKFTQISSQPQLAKK